MDRCHVALTIAIGACLASAARPDRRVVDLVSVGTPSSEATHGFVALDAAGGAVNGRSYRTARGWLRFALATFDDTEVTVACTFVHDGGGSRSPRRYDVLVEDSLIATRTDSSQSMAPAVEEFVVPFSLTKGRTNIAVVVRAHGGPTPALSEVRILQDHNEVDRDDVTLPVHFLRTNR